MDFSKINELKPYDLNCNIFDVYSYNGLSMQELLCQFFTKINDCIKTSNETIELAEWLVNEGLKQEVALKLTTWLNDGTLENLINVTLFENLNKKIDDVTSQLEQNEIKTSGYINVKSFGAIGDGVNDDYDSIQRAINYAYENKIYKIVIPDGWYYLSHCLETRNDNYWDAEGLNIEGCGFNTVLSRYPKNNTPNISTLIASENSYNLTQESVISIYSTKNIISNIKINYSKVGIYIGQDGRDISNASYTLFNRFTNIFIQNCGTGIVSRAGAGSYYNNFKNIQIAQGNVGIDVRKQFDGFNDFFNRNNFSDCEINKVYCGVALWRGDTNTFNAVHFEGIGLGNGAKPTWLPDGKSVAIYPKYQLNNFTLCVCEGNELDVYDDAYGTNYINNLFDIYNGKFKKGENCVLGTFIGYGTGGLSSYHKIGGILEQPTKALDNDCITNHTVFLGHVCDKGYELKKYNVLDSLTPSPKKQYSDGILTHKKVGGINYLWLKTSIVMNEEDKNKDIDLTLPHDVSSDLYSYTYRQGICIPIVVGGKLTYGRFVNNKFRIYKPENGWNIIDNAGYYTDIDVNLTYY